MNHLQFDEHIKKQFNLYTPDVPPHIWENIVAEKDKRKPFGFWYFLKNKNTVLLLIAIVLSGVGIWLGSHYYSSSTSKKTAISHTLMPVQSEDQPINQAAPPMIEKKNGQENNIARGEEKSGLSIEKTTLSQNSNQPVKNTDQSHFSSKTKDQGNEAGSIKNISKHIKGNALISFKNAVAEETDDNKEKELSDGYSAEVNLHKMALQIELLNTINHSIAAVKKPAVPFLDIPCPESEKNAAGNKRYVEIYAGPDYAFRSITDTGNSAYLQKRKESTSFSSAFSAGLRYTKVFSNGMSFRTGINYSQINEKFKYAEGNIIQMVYITNGNGDTIGSYATTGTRYKTTFNKFRTIDVPLLIGYELGNGKLHANFNVGAMVNVYSWQKGDVLDSSFKPVNITTGKNSSAYQFKTNVGIGFLGSVSVYYKLTERLHLLAEPYFRYNFSPASKSELSLKQKYNTAGMRLGVRFDF